MISMKKKRALRSALAITICTVTIASVSTPVYSAPSTDELENTTSDLKGELNDLNSQLSSLSKELDTASSHAEGREPQCAAKHHRIDAAEQAAKDGKHGGASFRVMGVGTRSRGPSPSSAHSSKMFS